MIVVGVDVLIDILANLEDVNINVSELVDGLIKGIIKKYDTILKSETLLADISYARKLLTNEIRLLKELERVILLDREEESKRIKRMEGRECLVRDLKS